MIDTVADGNFYAGSAAPLDSDPTGMQNAVTVGELTSGGFVTAWFDRNKFVMQLHDADGTKIGGEIAVASGIAAASPGALSIIGLSDGNFVVAWDGNGAVAYHGTVEAQIYAPDGTALGQPIAAGPPAGGSQASPSLTALDDGGFALAWYESDAGLQARPVLRFFDAAGQATTNVYSPVDLTAPSSPAPKLATLADGNVVMTWEDGKSGKTDVVGAIFTPQGVPTGDHFAVHGNYSGDLASPTITALASGGFAITYYDENATAGSASLMAHVYDEHGQSIGGELSVASAPDRASIASTQDGFLIAYTQQHPTGPFGDSPTQTDVTAQLFDLEGAKVGAAFTVNDAVTGNQDYASVATVGTGDLAFVYQTATSSDSLGNPVYDVGLSLYFNITLGSAKDDTLTGTAGDDVIQGLDGNDTLHGGAGNDQLFGGAGDDLLVGGAGNDSYDGGAGFDTVSFAEATAGIDANLTTGIAHEGGNAETLVSIENLIGSSFADTLAGDAGDNRLSGGAGDDNLYGKGGSDVLDGGDGNDTAWFDVLSHGNDIDIHDGAGTIVGSGGATTTLTSIETIHFLNGYVTFDPNSEAAEVMRLYDTVLHRAPDANGLDYWVDQMDHGTSYATVAAAFLGSSEFQAATGGLSDSDYVDFLYTSALGRAADPAGKAYWLDQLAHGATRADLLGGFSESTEHRGLTASELADGLIVTDSDYKQVAALYDTAVGREPDASGLVYWASELKTGAMTLSQVADGFAASSEFQAEIGGKSNADIVETMYENTLHRHADSAGLAYWTDLLDHGLTEGQLLLGFADSSEHYALIASHITNGIDYLS